MQSFLDLFLYYAKSELMILIPVLFVINKILDDSNIETEHNVLITSLVSVFLCVIYTFANTEISDGRAVLTAIFAAFTQSALYAGAGIFFRMLVSPSLDGTKIRQKKSDDKKAKCKKNSSRH